MGYRNRGKVRYKMKGGKPRQVPSCLFPGTMIDGTAKERLSGLRPAGYRHGPGGHALKRRLKRLKALNG